MQIAVQIKPSDKQIAAGNYRKQHTRLHGMDISIENPKGSVRSGTNRNGKTWSQKMTADYGYIRGTNGADDEQIDVFIGPDQESEKVFVVNQVIGGKFDEHKSILGCETERQARALYLSNYQSGWDGLGSIKEKSIAEFKDWLKNGKTEEAIKAARTILAVIAKAIRNLPLLPSKKNPMVRRHQGPVKQPAPRRQAAFSHNESLWMPDDPNLAALYKESRQTDRTQARVERRKVAVASQRPKGTMSGPADMELTVTGPFTLHGTTEAEYSRVNEKLKKYKTNLTALSWAFNLQHDDFYTGELEIEDAGNDKFTAKGVLRKRSNEAPAGTFEIDVRFADGDAYVGSFFLQDKFQGEGIAAALLDEAFAYFRKVGLKKVDLLADGTVGRYAWAVYGFDFRESVGQREGRLEELKSAVNEFLHLNDGAFLESQEEMIREGADECTYAWDIARFQINGKKIGKEMLLNGDDWHATFSLDPKDPCQRVFKAMLESQEAKKARKAMGNKDSEIVHAEVLKNEDKLFEILNRRFKNLNFDYRRKGHKPAKVYSALPNAWKGVKLVIAPTVIKAIISTPHLPGSSKVDWGAVPAGASIWITITDESSPLHGRHIVITKRADGQAVIDPGAARAAGYDVGKWQESSGLAHASFQMGGLKETRKDEEKWKEYEKRREERAPYEQQLRTIRGEASSSAKQLESQFLQSVGISKHGLTQIEKKTLADSAAWQAKDAGLAPDLAEAYGKTVAKMRDSIAKRFARDEALRRFKLYQKTLENLLPKKSGEESEAFREGEPQERTPEQEAELSAIEQIVAGESAPLEVEAPDFPLLADTPQEVELAVKDDMEKKAAQAQKRREANEEIREEAKSDSFIIRATQEGEDPLAKIIRTQDKEAAQKAVDSFQSFARSMAEKAEINKIIPPRLPRPETVLVATAMESLRQKAVEQVTDEEERLALERFMLSAKFNNDDAFYKVVNEHWNDEVGYAINGGMVEGSSEYLNGMLKRRKGFVSGSAATALTGLVGKHTGIEMDIGRLAEAFSPQVVATVVGYWLVGQARTRQLKGKSIAATIQAIEEDNKQNLLLQEDRALLKDKQLKASYEKIQQQKNNGELTVEATIMRQEAENILQRRENIGRAYGSLSASGSLLLAMKHAQSGIDERLSINVGSSRENATRILKEKFGISEGKMPPELKITHNIVGADANGDPLIQYQITSNASFLAKRWGSQAPIINKETAELNKLKSDPSPVTSLDNPPHFKQRWVNDEGVEDFFKFRPSQRNDVNWLVKTGGGVITRTTGAGKTLTTAGFWSHLVTKNPNFKGLALVPDGLTSQWADQLKRATNLNFVVIPEKQTKEQRQKFWAAVKPGQLVIASQSDALKSQMDVDAIAGHKFDFASVDEAQNLKSQTSEKLGAAAKKIMNEPFKHRLVTSASPARESLDEIYDWVNWATKEHTGTDKRGRPMFKPKIGSKVGFGRMYAGAGNGTNAQDEAIQRMVYDKISPYVSGDEVKTRTESGQPEGKPYKVLNEMHNTKRTPAQIEKQKSIENGYKELEAKIRTSETEKGKKAGKRKAQIEERINFLVNKEMQKRHWDNLHGGENNAKTKEVVDTVMSDIKKGNHTQVIFVDSDAQRVSIGAALRKEKIKGIYDLTELNKRAKFKEDAEKIAAKEKITPDQALERVIAQRKVDWGAHKEKGEPSVIFIDKTSQAGHNLNKGTSFHQAGRPQDASGYYQGIGRMERSPREGDMTVHDYRYSDSPYEDAAWNEVENQKKVTFAMNPSMNPALAKSVYVGIALESFAKAIFGQRILSFFGLRA